MDNIDEPDKPKSLYTRLSPELVNLAYQQNELFDLANRQKDIMDQMREGGLELKVWLNETLEVLFQEQDDIPGEELIARYGDTVLAYGNPRLDRVFTDILQAHERLVPGEFVMRGGIVREIGLPDGGEVAIPRLVRKSDNSYLKVDFTWFVPVVGSRDRLMVDESSIIGSEDIKRELHDLSSGYVRELSAADHERLASQYETLRESEKVSEHTAKAIGMSVSSLEGDAILTPKEYASNINRLLLMNPEGLNSFIDRLSVRIAEDIGRFRRTKQDMHLIHALQFYIFSTDDGETPAPEITSDDFANRVARSYAAYAARGLELIRKQQESSQQVDNGDPE